MDQLSHSTANDGSAFHVSQESISNITTTTSDLSPVAISTTTIAATALQLSPSNINDTALLTTISSQPNSSVVISDDDVQILSITKKEPTSKLSIKIESSDEEGSKDVSLIPKSETSSCRDVSDNDKSSCLGKDTAAGSSSPKESMCSICLGEFDNKAFLDQCFHAFCFYCILQWSEIVRTCPLCKAEFKQIIHSVKSMTEYQQHKLPPKENPTKNTSTSGRRFRYRTTLVDGRSMTSHNTTARPINAWEQRAERRERVLAMKRRRSIQAKEKRQSIYARNLWVQTVTQTGKMKYRDTSPQFFHANPACTHRLVPWLTRELQCLLNDEQSHVEFILQLILTLITKIPIDSQEFIEQVSPFLSEKTEHFCHEFMSYARSPFDMKAYDERAQYNWPRHTSEQVEQTPIVVDMSATGWDSPEEIQTPVEPFSNEPGPSGLSTHALSGWSPPIADTIELTATNVPEQITNDIIESSPEVIDVEIPKQKYRHKHKRKHKHRHKHKHRKLSCDYENIEPGPSRISMSPVLGSTSRVDVVVLSSSHDSSPEVALSSRKESANGRSDDDNKWILIHKGKQPKQSFHSSSETLKSRDSSSEQSRDDKHRKVRCKGKHSKRRYSRSREKSSEISRDSPRRHSRKHREKLKKHSPSLSPSTDPTCSISNDFSNSVARPSQDLVAKPSSSVVARPLSPTEEDMRQEILDLERKIAEDTRRLNELIKKQEQRKLVACAADASSLQTEDSETDGQSR